MIENIIEVRNLSKKFANHQAVKNISFDLKRGEIKGILGANGAGKTTTITMLIGFVNPKLQEVLKYYLMIFQRIDTKF